MYLPKITNAVKTPRVITERFGGLDRRNAAADNTFSDMENAAADAYPAIGAGRVRAQMFSGGAAVLAPDREEQDRYTACTGVVTDAEAQTAVFSYFGTPLMTLGSTTAEAYHPWECRQIVQFHNYYLLFPYPYWVLPKRGTNGTWTATGGALALERLYTTDGAESTSTTDAFTISPARLQFNGDLSLMKPLRQLFIRGELAVGSRFYLKISHENANPEAYQFVVTSYQLGDTGYYSYIYYDVFDTQGNPVSPVTQATTVRLCDAGGVLNLYRLCVDAAIGAVHQGRVFGADTLGRSLYCSSYSDFQDWTITGTADGGGFVNVSSGGRWTALESFGGYLYAFKADKLYRIAGSTALNYRADLVSDAGCFSQRAVCVHDGTLFYAGRGGVYAFTGTEPVCLSEPLGCRYVGGAVGAADGLLWCSLEREDGTYDILSYNLRYKMWHKRAGEPVEQFLPYGGQLYGLTAAGCDALDAAAPGPGDAFSLTTQPFHIGFDRKGVSEVWLRVTAAETAQAAVSVSYDGGPFVACGSTGGLRQARIPVRLRKCDSFRLRLEGYGAVQLDAAELAVYQGGRAIPAPQTARRKEP